MRRMPVPSPSVRRQCASIVRISGPLIVNNLAVAGMNFADTIMSGRLGADALAAVSVGSHTWMLVFSACLGLLMAVSPIVSRRFGAGEIDKIDGAGFIFAILHRLRRMHPRMPLRSDLPRRDRGRPRSARTSREPHQ